MQISSIIEKIQNQLKSKKALTLSPMGLALAACGGGGSGGVTENGSKPFVWNGASLNKGSLTATTSTLFDRTLDVYGVKLLVGGASGTQDAVPDAWAYKVAQSYVMLMDPTGSNIDVSAQENMKKILSGLEGTWHEGYGTSQRILKGAGSEYPLNDQEITAVFRERHALAPGDEVCLEIQPDKVHIFDKESGERLE